MVLVRQMTEADIAIYARPGLIGTGIGRALTDAALASATARGFTHMWL